MPPLSSDTSQIAAGQFIDNYIADMTFFQGGLSGEPAHDNHFDLQTETFGL